MVACESSEGRRDNHGQEVQWQETEAGQVVMAKRPEKHPEGGWKVGGRRVSSREKARKMVGGKPPAPTWRGDLEKRGFAPPSAD